MTALRPRWRLVNAEEEPTPSSWLEPDTTTVADMR
jgi:hypothetical protein